MHEVQRLERDKGFNSITHIKHYAVIAQHYFIIIQLERASFYIRVSTSNFCPCSAISSMFSIRLFSCFSRVMPISILTSSISTKYIICFTILFMVSSFHTSTVCILLKLSSALVPCSIMRVSSNISAVKDFSYTQARR